MKIIKVREKGLSYEGDAEYAYRLVSYLRDTCDLHETHEMPKMLHDFVFSIEVALQEVGVLDEDFNKIEEDEA